MLTIDNLLDYTNLEGIIRVVRWNEDETDLVVLFEDYAWELTSIDAEWMNTEIRFIFPTTEYDGTAKIVIEIE